MTLMYTIVIWQKKSWVLKYYFVFISCRQKVASDFIAEFDLKLRILRQLHPM